MTGIDQLSKAAAEYLAAQREASARADKDREAMRQATISLARWTRFYVVLTALAVLLSIYFQAHR